MALARAMPSDERSVERVLAHEPLASRHSNRILLAVLSAKHELELESKQGEGEAHKAAAWAV